MSLRRRAILSHEKLSRRSSGSASVPSGTRPAAAASVPTILRGPTPASLSSERLRSWSRLESLRPSAATSSGTWA